MGNLFARSLAAAPDALSCAIFLTAWIDAPALGPEWVRNLMLTMLIEFIVMHSSAFYSTIAANPDASRVKRAALLTLLSAFYLIFIAGFSFAFHSTWPFFAFGWLFVSRFVNLWTHPNLTSQATIVMMTSWGASLVFYLVGVFATILIPIPQWSLTPAFVASMHLSGSGLWIDRPQTVIVFGAFYFGALAWFKYHLLSKVAPAAARNAEA